MKKEVLLAILIGFVIGLGLTYFVYQSQILPSQNLEIVSPLPLSSQDQDSAELQSNLILEIISPIDQSITSEGSAIIKGKTVSLALVVALGEKGEKTLQADNEGFFETDLLLISGENEITITSFDENGNQISKSITIVNSTVEI